MRDAICSNWRESRLRFSTGLSSINSFPLISSFADFSDLIWNYLYILKVVWYYSICCTNWSFVLIESSSSFVKNDQFPDWHWLYANYKSPLYSSFNLRSIYDISSNYSYLWDIMLNIFLMKFKLGSPIICSDLTAGKFVFSFSVDPLAWYLFSFRLCFGAYYIFELSFFAYLYSFLLFLEFLSSYHFRFWYLSTGGCFLGSRINSSIPISFCSLRYSSNCFFISISLCLDFFYFVKKYQY